MIDAPMSGSIDAMNVTTVQKTTFWKPTSTNAIPSKTACTAATAAVQPASCRATDCFPRTAPREHQGRRRQDGAEPRDRPVAVFEQVVHDEEHDRDPEKCGQATDDTEHVADKPLCACRNGSGERLLEGHNVDLHAEAGGEYVVKLCDECRIEVREQLARLGCGDAGNNDGREHDREQADGDRNPGREARGSRRESRRFSGARM